MEFCGGSCRGWEIDFRNAMFFSSSSVQFLLLLSPIVFHSLGNPRYHAGVGRQRFKGKRQKGRRFAMASSALGGWMTLWLSCVCVCVCVCLWEGMGKPYAIFVPSGAISGPACRLQNPWLNNRY